MKVDKSEALAVVSRVGYDMLLRDGALIEPLREKNLIFINSTRTSHLPPKNVFSELHLIELRECDEYLAELIKSIGSRYPIRQVLTISEQDLTPVVYAREKLGFAGLQPAKAAFFRDKILMKEALAGSGLILPAYAHAIDDRALENLFSKFQKMVIKPRDGYGSQDTSVIDSRAKLDAFLSRPQSQRSGFLAENFVSGDIYHLDAVVRSGEILFSSLGKYIVAPLEFSGRRWAGTKFSNARTSLLEAAQKDLLTVLASFGVTDGVFHFEFFSNGDERVFGEIAIRPAGGGIADAIYHAFGVHLVEEHVRIQLELPTSIASPTTKVMHGASLLMLSEAPGTIQGFKGLDSHSYASLKGINYHYKEGDTVSPTRYSADSLLTVSLATSDMQVLGEEIARLEQEACVVLA